MNLNEAKSILKSAGFVLTESSSKYKPLDLYWYDNETDVDGEFTIEAAPWGDEMDFDYTTLKVTNAADFDESVIQTYIINLKNALENGDLDADAYDKWVESESEPSGPEYALARIDQPWKDA